MDKLEEFYQSLLDLLKTYNIDDTTPLTTIHTMGTKWHLLSLDECQSIVKRSELFITKIDQYTPHITEEVRGKILVKYLNICLGISMDMVINKTKIRDQIEDMPHFSQIHQLWANHIHTNANVLKRNPDMAVILEFYDKFRHCTFNK